MSEIISHGGTMQGVVTNSDTTQSTSTSSGSIQSLGGLGIAKDIYCANLFADNVTNKYTTGTVTQITSKTTAVTLNTMAGVITSHDIGTINTHTTAQFRLNNTNITATSIIMLTVCDDLPWGTNISCGVWGKPGAGIVDIALYVNDNLNFVDKRFRINFLIINP